MAIRSVDSILKFERWIGQLRRQHSLDRVIDAVSARMREADGDDRYQLALELRGLLVEARRDREAVPILDEVIRQNPSDVRLPISKATLHLHFLNEPHEALRCIDIALDRACHTGFFRREALGVKARILLKLGRGEELTRVLEEIMSMKMIKGVADVGRERDFVDRAPPRMIPEDVLARYNKFRPKRPEDGTADEPPEWEPPEWE